MMRIKGIRRIYRFFLCFLINHIFVGTGFYSIKRKLMMKLGHSIGGGTRIVGPVFCTGQLTIGQDCWIGRNLSVNGNGKVVIGDRCDIAPDCSFLTGGHKIGSSERRAGEGENYSIIVEDGCWIGARSTLLGNMCVKKNSVVAACACVTKDVPENVLYGGVPAKLIRELDEMK